MLEITSGNRASMANDEDRKEPAAGRTLTVERHSGSGGGFARIALIGAGVIALAAVGIAVVRKPAGAPSALRADTAEAPAPPAGGDIGEILAKLEAAAKADPKNAEGWRKLGWAYYGTEQFQKAADAYTRATALQPDNAEGWSALGEALVYTGTSEEPLKPQAIAAFKRALALSPGDPRARYFLAVARDLKGDHKGAIEDWLALLKDTPPGAPWESSLRDTIVRAGEQNHIEVASRMRPPSAPPASEGAATATAAIPGPTREQMAAASALPPGQQDAMVRGMVDSLARKLKANPKDADGWLRLMRARMVLGERTEAARALAAGRAAFAGDAATQARLSEGAKALGVPGS